MRTTFLLAASLIFVACGGDEGEGTPNADTSSPKKVVEALVRASAAKDVATLKSLIAKGSEKELAPLRDGTATPKTMDQWYATFGNAKVGVAKVNGDRAAVDIVLGSGEKERVNVIKEDGRWLVHGL